MGLPTDILPPRYRGARRIGRGGMGEIFRATDDALGRAVAIKVLAEPYAQDDDVRERFTREALAAARLSGEPNTVTIFDVGEWQDRPFIVMEYLSGGSLEEHIRRGPVPPSQALEWLEQAARALDAAHANGVVHRDVKPANLLLDRNGNVQVADFGIASAAGLSQLTKPGTVLGTAGYLAPEQARGERSTPASDQYALAVVAWELLTGTRPFERDSATAEATAHASAPVPSISERDPSLPRKLDAIFDRALAKAPGARFGSCEELVGELRRAFEAAAGTTSRLAPVGVPTAPTAPARAAPTARRRSLAWPLALAGLAALALAGIGLAALLDDGDGGGEAGPSTVVKTVLSTAPGTTVREEVTVTAEPPPPAEPPAPAPPAGPPPAASGSPAELNDRGYALMQQGDFAGALPLLEQSVAGLQGSGDVVEAYASYNLAYTRFQLGRCDGVLELLDRSEEVQGERREIDQLRKRAEKRCDG